MYSIEWQKGGLPHAHILIWLKVKIRPRDVDRTPPHVPVPDAITTTVPVEWTWDERCRQCYQGGDFRFTRSCSVRNCLKTYDSRSLRCPKYEIQMYER
ncbi:hypothetical protein AVEN_229696-1 [Araneus ventricosus]|uniref:Helitron helicase-like domain-containing protein n=1 Tax=Araneus ventricosus TaxID=182803 RepID=A0A4Y2IRB8_ARAVE|nr:hypothetical protein AVEN_229696-1 [Araneus ventricosus]